MCDFTAQHSQCTFKGIGADAGFLREDGCLLTGVDVSILQDVSHSSTDPSAETTQIFVEFDQNDACSFVQVAQAEGQAVGVDVQGDQQLTTASVNATVPLTGFGVPDGFTLTISVTWHGIGETTTATDTSKVRTPGGHIITRTVTSERSGIATGTVSDGTTNYASMPSTFTDLFYDHAGQVVIDHP